MLRTKISELGKLSLQDDGGLICSVTTDEPPPLDPSALRASFSWVSPDLSELAVGDLAAHWDYGVARYRGCETVNTLTAGQVEQIDFHILEFAEGREIHVPVALSHLVQKLGRVTCQLNKLDGKGVKLTRSYSVEALPNAYQWPGIAAFPEFPKEQQRTEKTRRLERITQGKTYKKEQQIAETPFHETVVKWHSACAAYQKSLHASSSYRQAAQLYFEKQSNEPLPLLDWWSYRGIVLRVGPIELANDLNRDELILLIKQYVLRRDRSIEKIRREVETLENYGRLASVVRESIPEEVRLFVWRRDNGQCVRCGSRERLEFDHIIPVIAGGSSTERNVQLLCESCNRSKGATV
jgi:5-methylcytosine-specific restriction endonuclease McrA